MKYYNYLLIIILLTFFLIFFILNQIKVDYDKLQNNQKNRINNVGVKGNLLYKLEVLFEGGEFANQFEQYLLNSHNNQQYLNSISTAKVLLKQYTALPLSANEKDTLQEIKLILDEFQSNKHYTAVFSSHFISKKIATDSLTNKNITTLIRGILSLKQAVNEYRQTSEIKERQIIAELMNSISLLGFVILSLFIIIGIIGSRLVSITGRLTKEVRLNEQLLKEAQLNATAFDSNEAILITDAEKHIIKVNKAFCLITGYQELEVIGKTPKLLQSGEHGKEFYSHFWRSINDKGLWAGEIIDRKKNNDLFVTWTNISSVLDKQNKVEYYVSHFSDMTEYKNTQAAFVRRIKIENIVSEIAITILESGFSAINMTIDNCLQLLGNELAVDRCYLFSLSDDLSFMSNTHEWCAEGVKPKIELMQEIAVDLYPWLMKQLLSKKVVRIDDVDDLPSEASNEYLEMQRQSIQSILFVPIYDREQLTGYFGFDRVKQKRPWRDEDIVLFKIIAKVFHLVQYRHDIEMENKWNLSKTVQLLAENTELLEKNRNLAIKTIQVQEQERHYLAHELHDELGQIVTAIRMDVAYLQTLLNSEDNSPAKKMIDSIDNLSRKMIRNLRSTIQRIRPETLDHLGLIPALNELVSDWLKHNKKITVKTSFMEDSNVLDENVTVTLYRAVQEGLTNISKYAHASHVEITLELNQAKNRVQLTITDDGIGVTVHATSKEGVGLLAMEERVNALQGLYTISSAEKTSGTCIIIQIPL